MERYTEYDEYGNAEIIDVSSPDLQMNLDFDDMNRVTDALNHFAAYEDTGLTPEQCAAYAKAESEGRGEWLIDKSTIKCSICGFGMYPDGYYFMHDVCISAHKPEFRPRYCPNCGAKMEDVT